MAMWDGGRAGCVGLVLFMPNTSLPTANATATADIKTKRATTVGRSVGWSGLETRGPVQGPVQGADSTMWNV